MAMEAIREKLHEAEDEIRNGNYSLHDFDEIDKILVYMLGLIQWIKDDPKYDADIKAA